MRRLGDFGAAVVLSAMVVSCASPQADDAWPKRGFESEPLRGCMFASPKLVRLEGEEPFIVVATHEGVLFGLDPTDASTLWSFELPTVQAGLEPLLIATPKIVGERLIVVYQGFDPEVSEDPFVNQPASRREHVMRVFDLRTRTLDAAFEPLVLGAELEGSEPGETVVFNPPTQLSRSAIQHAVTTPDALGAVYASFGNKGDFQPWHGWVFEVDLDAWLEQGPDDAVTGVLLTTREAECGTGSGMADMLCGGGVWAPAGPLVIGEGDERELLVPTGNGQTDLERFDYANGLLRVGAGMTFDPGCDMDACADFDPLAPADACLASCSDYFVPRELPDDPPLAPDQCPGMTFLECYAALDYDFGANTPARVELEGGLTVYLQPAKDGHVYLLDADHLGTMYDRLKIMDVCGADGAECVFDWTGMMVTKPVMIELQGDPVALIPTFVYDALHPAGLVAVRIRQDGGVPKLEVAWQAPDFDSEEAVQRFRSHPSAATLTEIEGTEYAWVVDVRGFKGVDRANDKRTRSSGALIGVRTSDGEIAGRSALHGRGQRYLEPLEHDGHLYVGSCTEDNGTSRLEAFVLDAPDAG